MIYNIFNGVGIVLGALIGRVVGHKMSDEQIDSILVIANLSLLVIGMQGAIQTENSMLMMISLVVGGIIGTAIDIDGKFYKLGETLQSKFKGSNPRHTRGIVQVMMIHAIGSMAIIGPVNAALKNDGSLLILKTVLDLISSIIFSTSFGFGVALSGITTFTYQSFFFMLATFIAPILTPEVINEISAIGSVLILALSFNLLKMKEIKISNYLPAILGPMIYHIFQSTFL
ncbi:MAG: DUF554 domain-containing protein [Tissierellia bacterium]|jgi:uncharacterized membrane protein YqgA involved in biofilm formation|nr:DUF554 domain-containing protein [Tissierellia bacterium]